MSRAHIPPGFIHIEVVYPIGADGELTVRCGAPGEGDRYEIKVTNICWNTWAHECVNDVWTGPTFTAAKCAVYEALWNHPATLAAVRAVLEPKKRRKKP